MADPTADIHAEMLAELNPNERLVASLLDE